MVLEQKLLTGMLSILCTRYEIDPVTLIMYFRKQSEIQRVIGLGQAKGLQIFIAIILAQFTLIYRGSSRIVTPSRQFLLSFS